MLQVKMRQIDAILFFRYSLLGVASLPMSSNTLSIHFAT
jgi:hypothetical protein